MLKLWYAFDLIWCSYNFPAALCPWLQGTSVWGHCSRGSNSDDRWRKDCGYFLERSKRPSKIWSKVQQSVKQRPRVNLVALCGWYGEKAQTVRHGETGYRCQTTTTTTQVLWSAEAEVTCRTTSTCVPPWLFLLSGCSGPLVYVTKWPWVIITSFDSKSSTVV